MSNKIENNKLYKKEYSNSDSYNFQNINIPKMFLSEESMPSKIAYELIHNQLILDGNPSHNLASFVSNWMEKEATKLILENMGKNFVNVHEYPQTYKIERYCLNIIANLFNIPNNSKVTGFSTIGSSEAIILGLLAHKWTWKKNRELNNLPTNKPNIVVGADVHTVWKKFALYFDVELKQIPMKKDKYTINAEDVINNIDENTICVGTVFGTTYTGQIDSIKEINDELVKIKKRKGWDIPIHVDAASGGFVAPFIYPDLEWDFRLEQVKSINVSGHKYGLVYPGIAWLIFKSKTDLPSELIFNIEYLDGEMPNYSINFSKGSSLIIAQYYNFLHLGKKGYTNVMKKILNNTKYLLDSLLLLDKFELLNKELLFPVITLTLKDSSKYNVYQISTLLKTKEWIVPAYTLPPNAENIDVLRIVVKENFDKNIIDNFIADLNEVIEKLENNTKNE